MTDPKPEPTATTEPPGWSSTPAAPTRRAPFSDNPRVGARGQRTQQRILDAALEVLGEVGYDQCSIERITQGAGCARASFYQYFSGKADVFRHLASQVATQLDAAIDWLQPITPDQQGWASLRDWVGRYAQVYDRHEPVFHTFQAAAESDAGLAGDFVRTGRRYVMGMQARVEATTLSARDLEAVVGLLQRCMPRMLDDTFMLRRAVPEAFPLTHLLDAFTDVTHRTLFGLLPAINVHEHRGPRPPRLPFGPAMRAALDRDGQDGDGRKRTTSRDGPSREALLAAGREVFVSQGYHGARIAAIVEAAGVSHGTFYHYFPNKEQLAHELATEAMRRLSTMLPGIPEPGESSDGEPSLRRWLADYDRAQASQTAVLRAWVDAALQDRSLMTESAPVLDWGRRQMARYLAPRGFGDVETDAVVMLALLDALDGERDPEQTIDAAVLVVERGLFGR